MRVSRGNAAARRRLVGGALLVAMAGAATPIPIVRAAQRPPAYATADTTPAVPAGYVIGTDDVLSVVVWREVDMSSDVVVRPDGMISLPLLNDIRAAGLTPDELRVAVTAAATRFVESPTVSIVVKTINSRRVFIEGEVARPGAYALSGPLTVVQLIALAGGLNDWANRARLSILRIENGRSIAIAFNYRDVLNGKNLSQNIELRPGDTVMVP